MLDKRYRLMNWFVIYSRVQRYDKLQVMLEILEFVRWFPGEERILINLFNFTYMLFEILQ